MINIRFPDPEDPGRLVAACLIAAGFCPAPKGREEAEQYQRLADELGDGLDRLPARPVSDG